MVDVTPSMRSVPLPEYQSGQASHDPLPVSSPKAITQDASVRAETRIASETAAFGDYLDQTSITLVESDSDKRRQRDAADLISQQSVYLSPGIPLGV